MPYLVLSANGEELNRLELKKAVTIGRSPECELSVHDILLSRRHCRVEPVGRAWRIVDLDSKNGTRFNWQKISEHVLAEGDVLRIGRTWVTFHAGAFEPPAESPRPKIVRPADPFEALNGTVTDFVYVEPEEKEPDDFGALHPSDPADSSGSACGILATESASSSWDSIVATASRPVRRLGRPMPRPLPRPQTPSLQSMRANRTASADLSLQVTPQQLELTAPAAPCRRHLGRRLGRWLLALVQTPLRILGLFLLRLAGG